MTKQAQPGRPPAHDLSAFDLSKRSPEQLAQSFARWKAQRKRQPEAARAAQPLQPQPSATIVADPAPEAAPSRRTKSPEYSATFSALLQAGSEPTVQRADPAPIAVRPAPKPQASSGRRLKAMSILAGAASLVALAGGALLEFSGRPDADGAKPQAVQIHPRLVPAAPIAAAAMKAPAAAWALQRTIDVALMTSASAADVARRLPSTAEPPMVRTASKAASIASKPVPSGPASKKAVPETAPFVAKPFIPSDATAALEPSAIPAAPVVVRSRDPRPDALFQQRREGSTTASGRVASGGKPAEAAGAQSSGEVPSARTATARGKAANGGSGDPRGEGSGGARVGSAVNDETGGANADAGETGAKRGASAPAGAGSGDAGSDTDGGGTTGNSAASSSDTGGDAAGESSKGGSGAGEDSKSGGIGGAIGSAVDAVGDALGGAVGGGKGNPDSNDKDQRN